MKDNLIFLKEEDLDTPIYRIFSFKRLEEVFKEKKLTLVKPELWDDPFENFILHSIAIRPDGSKFEIEFRDDYYGQCWSLQKESDAMWRIYSPEKDGVKVKTTIRKLIQSLLDAENTSNNNYYSPLKKVSFIGKVKYEKAFHLVQMLKDKERMSNKIYDETGWGQASTFFFKREAFRHEKEVRIIFNSQYDHKLKLHKININPLDLFDNIVFDPRMTREKYIENKLQVKNWGYTKPIRQSSLYKLRALTLLLKQ